VRSLGEPGRTRTSAAAWKARRIARQERRRLRDENARLRKMLGIDHSLLDQSVSQNNIDPGQRLSPGETFTHRKERSLSSAICFARTFSPFRGKEGTANLDIRRQVS